MNKFRVYRDKYYHNEDYDLWFRAALSGLKGDNMQEYLYYYRSDKSFLDRRRGRKLAVSEYNVKKDYLGCGFFPWYTEFSPYLSLMARMLPKWLLSFMYGFTRVNVRNGRVVDNDVDIEERMAA